MKPVNMNIKKEMPLPKLPVIDLRNDDSKLFAMAMMPLITYIAIKMLKKVQ